MVVKDRPKSATITRLVDLAGQQVTDRASLERIVLEFYRQLYTTLPPIIVMAEAEGAILQHIPCSFPQYFSEAILQ
jgi:hypothetical protein